MAVIRSSLDLVSLISQLAPLKTRTTKAPFSYTKDITSPLSSPSPLATTIVLCRACKRCTQISSLRRPVSAKHHHHWKFLLHPFPTIPLPSDVACTVLCDSSPVAYFPRPSCRATFAKAKVRHSATRRHAAAQLVVPTCHCQQCPYKCTYQTCRAWYFAGKAGRRLETAVTGGYVWTRLVRFTQSLFLAS